MYLTKLDHPEYSDWYNKYDGYGHPVILHKNHSWHLGRFPSMEKAKEFMDFAGLQLGELVEEKPMGKCGMYRQWAVESEVVEHGFSSLSDIPEGAKEFIGLSNGSLVPCYLLNDGNLHIYRPNPNVKEIYRTMDIDEEIAYRRENGYV